jgi:hypothetical protein
LRATVSARLHATGAGDGLGEAEQLPLRSVGHGEHWRLERLEVDRWSLGREPRRVGRRDVEGQRRRLSGRHDEPIVGSGTFLPRFGGRGEGLTGSGR